MRRHSIGPRNSNLTSECKKILMESAAPTLQSNEISNSWSPQHLPSYQMKNDFNGERNTKLLVK